MTNEDIELMKVAFPDGQKHVESVQDAIDTFEVSWENLGDSVGRLLSYIDHTTLPIIKERDELKALCEANGLLYTGADED